jgi:hypothetical protein
MFADSIERHVKEEGDILDEYRVLSEKLRTGPIWFLVDLILTEEEQHHFLLSSMAKHLHDSLFTDEQSSALEQLSQQELLAQTQVLREHEEETITSFRELQTQLTMEQPEFYQALLEAIIRDSQKHNELLSIVEKMIQAQVKSK